MLTKRKAVQLSLRAALLLLATGGAFLAASASWAATITVNSTADVQAEDGQCTLREAILAARNDLASGASAGECAAGSPAPTRDIIAFNIPPTDAGCDVSGVCTITPKSSLPYLQSTTIDGYTQTGATPNTMPHGTNAVLKIVLTGTSFGLTLGSDNTVRGLVVNGCGTAIWSDFGSKQEIVGCFIGTNASGTAAVANSAGVYLGSGTDATVGGSDSADRNLISGNSNWAIEISEFSGVVVQGNLIGTDASGIAALPNGGSSSAISVSASNPASCLIGGPELGAGNVISGNVGLGIAISGPVAATIQGNLIGTTADGGGPLGNSKSGIRLSSPADSVIGGLGPGEANVIAYNNTDSFPDSPGVWVFAPGSHVTVRGNSIHDNGGNSAFFGYALGLDVGPVGVTPNDPGDTGLPFVQNFPEIVDVTASSVSGTLSSKPSTTYHLDFYGSSTCSPTGYGEGRSYVGSKDVSTDSGGNVNFVFDTGISGEIITATATSPDGDTSEFSRCASLLPAFLDVDPFVSAGSDGDGVLEPGESARVRPSWTNTTSADFTSVTSELSAWTGPAGVDYSIVDGVGAYPAIAKGQNGGCATVGDCFTLFVSDPGSRPATHWDASFNETLSSRPVSAHVWKVHLGDSFTDVPRSQLFYKKIETVLHNGIAFGCTTTAYCPSDKVRRSQMAIFLARGIAAGVALPTSGIAIGKPYNCVGGGTSAFVDVAPTDIFCKAVHYIAAQNVTGGCDPTHYCPDANVTRAEMAIFVAKAMVAPGGGAAVPLGYGPDPITTFGYSCNPAGPALHFTDIAVTDSFCKHVHFLWAKGVVGGCSGALYCPTGEVARDEMAKFLSNAFGLKLYGP